jgi:hypothetical protein
MRTTAPIMVVHSPSTAQRERAVEASEQQQEALASDHDYPLSAHATRAVQ